MKQLFCLLPLMLLLACSVSVEEKFDQQIDFSRYKTFCWMAGCEFKVDGPAYLQDSLVQQRIKSAIINELAAKGITLNAAQPDLLVGFTITIKDEQAIVYHRAEDSPIFIRPLEMDKEVIKYQKGSLIIGMADAKASSMVWQSHVSAYMELEPDLSEVNIQKGIKMALKNFPPNKSE
ncbi:MAG: DUF4136 domain-containing protein [Cyclobacteriaceae bacterium]|nr:DUF4136 domain-containing protein [Cyclobacteriaceae bacterium]